MWKFRVDTLVYGVWALLLLITILFVKTYSANVPFSEDWINAEVVTGKEPLSIDWLWDAGGAAPSTPAEADPRGAVPARSAARSSRPAAPDRSRRRPELIIHGSTTIVVDALPDVLADSSGGESG